MKSLISILCVSVTLFGCMSVIGQTHEGMIGIGKKDSLYSSILKEMREIWVHVPSAGGPDIFSKPKYPVIYLLDGEAHFYSVAGMIHQLSKVNGNTISPEMIIVGVNNTDRTRDLTPTHTLSGPMIDSNFARNSGGGEKFTAFLEKELIPYIDSAYPAAPYRMLIGHSLGGLMVINTLIHHTGLFNAYLSIDPSMWWHGKKLLGETADSLRLKKFQGRTLFLGIANTLSKNTDTVRMKKDSSLNTFHIRSIFQLRDELIKHKNNGLRWKYKYYNEDDHGSVPLISEYDALRFIFDFYRYRDMERLFDSSFNADSSLTAHYKNVSTHFGYRVHPPEHIVNMLGYFFLQNKNLKKSYDFFRMNADNYPESFNVFDSLGDYYVAAGNTEKARDSFQKALALRDNPDTRSKLHKLNTEKSK